MTLEDILKKEEMPMGKSQRFAVIARSQAMKQSRSEGNPEGKVRSPGPGARSGIDGSTVSSCHCEEREWRSDLKRDNALMRQERIGLLEKKTRLKSGEVDSGCEMR